MKFVVVLTIYFLISMVYAHTVEDCALYLQYNGGGAYSAVVTDAVGVVYTTPISYVCGEKAFSWTVPFQVCVECPTTGVVSNTYKTTLVDTTTSTTLFLDFPLTCTGGPIHTICGFPTFTNPLHPFRSYSLTFNLNRANFHNAGTSGDPHFRGFRGQSFDFQGEKGKVFNIISDKYSSVNARFSDPTHDSRKLVTYMTSFGVQYADLKVEINANQTEGQIIANNVVITLPLNVEVKLSDCVMALYRKGLKHSAVQIQSNHEIYDFTLVSSEYINFGLTVKNDDLQSLGGILGLTEKDDFNIEDYNDTDFKEVDLFSSSSTYTRYAGSELLCSDKDVVITLAPGQMTLPPITKPVAHTAHISHDTFVETFTTN